MASFDFKGVNISFEEQGSGPAVIFIHGFLENKNMWKHFIPHLAGSRKIICLDLPGHGESDCIGYVHTMEEMAECVYELIGHLNLRRVTLVGHSMGGYVALAFAEKYPDHVRNLVLYQSTARADSEWKKKDRLRAIELVKKNHKSFIRNSIPMLFRPVNRKRYREQINEIKEEALKTPLQGVIAAIDGMRQRPDREILLKFPPYPVHIIAGDKDPRIPIEESVEQAEASDEVHLHVIKGCGHMSYIEAIDETLKIFKSIF